MTRAEQFACKYAGLDHSPTRRDELEEREKCDIYGACLDAYEQAEKDTIERAAAWLKDYVKYFELYDEKGVEEFKKAMEEE